MKPRKMKDSGIPWIGEIPEGWEVRRLKRSCNLLVEKCPSRGDEVSDGLTYLGLEHIESQFGRLVGDYRPILDFSGDAIRFWKGNILFGKLRPYLAKCWFSDIDGKCSSEFFVLAPNDSFCGNYLQWTMLSNRFIDLVDGSTFGVKMPRAEWNFVGGIQMPCPKSDEQARIAAYLDEKCGEIDRVIAAKERQNELLRDQRAAVIHEAVTKGLNPKAKFKESGYEWIGRVPEDWKVLKLRYVGSCQNGISKSGDLFGSGFPFVSYGDVYQNEVLPESVAGLVESTLEDQENYSVRDGDVFFTRTSETIEEIGLTSVCMKTIEKATFAGFVIRVRPFAGMLDKAFSKYYFRCIMHRGFFVKEMNIVTRASLGQDLLKKLPVLLPSLPEQRQIAAHLDARCGEIDRVMAANEGMVAKLKEYRASLIWEAVTGKKCL